MSKPEKAWLSSHISAKGVEKIYENRNLPWDFPWRCPRKFFQEKKKKFKNQHFGHRPYCSATMTFCMRPPLPARSCHHRQHEEVRDRHNALLGILHTERPRLLTVPWELLRPAIGTSIQAALETPAPKESRVCPHALLQQAGPCTSSKREITNRNCFCLNTFMKNNP